MFVNKLLKTRHPLATEGQLTGEMLQFGYKRIHVLTICVLFFVIILIVAAGNVV